MWQKTNETSNRTFSELWACVNFVEKTLKMNRQRMPSTSKTDKTIERVYSIAISDRGLTSRMLSEQLNLNRFTTHKLLIQHLQLRKVCAENPHNSAEGRLKI